MRPRIPAGVAVTAFAFVLLAGLAAVGLWALVTYGDGDDDGRDP